VLAGPQRLPCENTDHIVMLLVPFSMAISTSALYLKSGGSMAPLVVGRPAGRSKMILMKGTIAAAFVFLMKVTIKRQVPEKTLTVERLIQMGAGN
jgi:hypothetical protein